MADGSRVEEFLADRPDRKSSLRDVLDVDEDTNTWTFEDVPVDSGMFGELVSRGIVEKAGDQYRLADPDTVRAILNDETPRQASPSSEETATPTVTFPRPTINARIAGLLAGAIVLVITMRAFVSGGVFRDGNVVLSGNDPYFYRYWVEQSLSAGSSLVDLPSGITRGEPFLVGTLTWISDLFGGIEQAGTILAVYPVVSAVLTAVLLYWLTLCLTADRRIALTSVIILAVMPGHGLRTAIGFADHHAFDYIWLALTATALVTLVAVADREDLTDGGTWLVAIGLGVSVGAQTLAWDNGPLLLVPVAAVVAGRVLLDVDAGRPPVIANAPTLVGLALGAVIAFLGHTQFGWHNPAVAFAPAFLCLGAVGIVAAAELTHRLDRRAAELAVLETIVGLASVWMVFTSFPDLQSRLLRGLGLIGRTDNIVETEALFSGDTFGFLLLFGFFLFMALPVLVVASKRAADGDVPWLVACAYGWYFFGLSLFQVRFTGQLGIFTALFAAAAFVWLAAKVDLAQRPTLFDDTDDRRFDDWTPASPDVSTVAALFALFLLVGGLGVMQTAIKVEQVTTPDAEYETAAWMAGYADDQDWESRSESYVFSEWGKNRLYNYFVNGNSLSYNYAQQNYGEFMTQTDPEEATSRLADRVRFIVTRDRETDTRMMHTRLHTNLGSRTGDVAGLGQYRAVFTTDNGERKTFLVVPGATISGQGQANSTVDLTTDVDIPGTSFTYERRTTTNETGAYDVRVAQPGTYDISTANGTATVTVPESAVMNGTTVTVGE